MLAPVLFILEPTVVILYFILTSLVLVAFGWAWQQRQLALGWKTNFTELQSIIYCSAQHLLTVINEILDFSKLEAGEARLETVNFDLDSCIETVLDLLMIKAEEKNLELIVLIDSHLPRQLKGDPLRLHQVLLNFISNAIKFTENREGVKLVRALHDYQAETPTKMILMSKINQRDRAEQVINLGDYSYLLKPVAPLRFLQSLVVTLNLKSPPILTRLHQWQHQTHRLETFNNRDQRFNRQPHPLKILLAEDDPINQKVILSQLKLLGYDADLVNNGQTVLERLTYNDYDIILMDCQMPILDGYEATQRLRQHPEISQRQPIVIALTASAMSSDRERCIEAGMDDYLSKPVELNALGQVLQRWSNSRLCAPNSSPSVLPSADSCNLQPACVPETSTLESSPMSNLKRAEIPVNLERLNRLFKGNLQLQQRLLQLFIEQAQVRIQTLDQAIINQDFTSIRQQAHALKGSSATAGVLKIPEIAKQLEDLALQQNIEGATELVEKLQQHLSRVQLFVQEGIS